MSNAIEYVWVVTTFTGYVGVTRYELVRRTAKQLVVRCRSAAEYYLRPQIGQHWFFTEDTLKDFVKARYEQMLRDAESRVQTVRERLEKPVVVDIIPYTPGQPPPIRLK